MHRMTDEELLAAREPCPFCGAPRLNVYEKSIGQLQSIPDANYFMCGTYMEPGKKEEAHRRWSCRQIEILRRAAQRALAFFETMRVPQNIEEAGMQVWQGSMVIDSLRSALHEDDAGDTTLAQEGLAEVNAHAHPEWKDEEGA